MPAATCRTGVRLTDNVVAQARRDEIHRIAAELRLWDAIDQHRLAPFAYYGIHDGLDLRNVPWKRGRGYNVGGLTNVLTANDAWARLVLQQLASHVDDVGRMRALGFCVSVEHARFMARVFATAGVRAVAIWGDSPEAERRAALADLAALVVLREIQAWPRCGETHI